MIHLNATIGTLTNQIVAEFGIGDISMIVVGNSLNPYSAVCLRTQEPQEIGSKSEHSCETLEEIKPQITLLFSKVESIDVLVETLLEAKELLESYK